MLNTLVRTRTVGLMRTHGLSQAALSRAAKVRPNDLSRFLSDDMVYPPLDFLDRLARVFQYTVADLLAQDLPPPALIPEELTLLARYRATADPVKRQAFVSLLQPASTRRRHR